MCPGPSSCPYSPNLVEGGFSEVPSVSNRWPENQSEIPSASCMGKSWPAQTDLIIVWSHCGVGGCSEGRGRTYHPPRLHAQGHRELLDRCEDRKRQKEEPPWERSSPRLRCRWTATSPIYLTTWVRSSTGPPPGTSRSLARIRIWSSASPHRALTTYARRGRTSEPRRSAAVFSIWRTD